MDYIIFGIGTSASLVLIGWLLRDWGPRLRDRKPAEDVILSASQLVVRMAWTRFCATCGMAMVLCGVLVMLVTIVVLFVAPGDRTATIATIAAFSTTALLMLTWTGLYLRQFGSVGVHRPVDKTTPAQAPVVADPVVGSVAARDEPVPTPAGAPTFAEAAAARGGLGRFAGFLRRDAKGEPDSGQPAQPSSVEVGANAAELAPTDAVIAEIHGEIQEADSKKLGEDDPLVTSVRAELAGTGGDGSAGESNVDAGARDSSADEQASDDDSLSEAPASDVTAIESSEIAPADEGAASESLEETPEAPVDAPSGDRPDHELALESLRKQRLGRLGKTSDPE